MSVGHGRGSATSSSRTGRWPPRFDRLAVRFEATVLITVVNEWL